MVRGDKAHAGASYLDTLETNNVDYIIILIEMMVLFVGKMVTHICQLLKHHI